MKKSNLISGELVVLRNGDKCVVSTIKGEVYFVDIKDGNYIDLNCYTIDLKYAKQKEIYDVVKVYKDYTCNELLWEEIVIPTLDGVDRKQLEILKELGYTHIKRDILNHIWLYDEDGSFNITYLFVEIYKTLEYEKKYLIEDLLRGE